MEISEKARGKITVIDRKSITLDGVKNVLGFDEGYIAISTELGEVHIEGEGLKIENLSKEKGEILITGMLYAIYYKEKTFKKRKGF